MFSKYNNFLYSKISSAIIIKATPIATVIRDGSRVEHWYLGSVVVVVVIARTLLLIEKHEINNDRTQDNQTDAQTYDGFVRSSGLFNHRYIRNDDWFLDDWFLIFVCHL
tara:strand:+ start:1213 stop:1539 length:327 start_codon:yes stop_codon:yes gene_type:complete